MDWKKREIGRVSFGLTVRGGYFPMVTGNKTGFNNKIYIFTATTVHVSINLSIGSVAWVAKTGNMHENVQLNDKQAEKWLWNHCAL